ncbi:MAG: hypothetical protein RR073_05630 [Clostridia bacterium]
MQKTDLHIKHDEQIIVKTVNQNRISRPFDSFGTDPHNKGFSSIYDILEQLNPKSLKLFCMLARNKDYNTNETVLSRKKLKESEIYALNKGYKQLENLNLVKRIRDETYLLNPDYVIPKIANLKKIKEKYQENKETKVDINTLLEESANT